MVSAWGCEQRIVLAQIATDAESDEITAIPALLKMLKPKGTIVTVDALNGRRAIAGQITGQDGDDGLALEGNQSTSHDDVRRCFDDPNIETATMKPVVEGAHGGVESRKAAAITAVGWPAGHGWPGLQAIGEVARRCEVGGTTKTETAYDLLSCPLSPERLDEVARLHRGIENRLHGRLVVVMNEDHDRTRLDNAPD